MKEAGYSPLFFVRSGRPENQPGEPGGYNYSDWGHYWSSQADLVSETRTNYFLGFANKGIGVQPSRTGKLTRLRAFSLRCLAI